MLSNLRLNLSKSRHSGCSLIMIWLQHLWVCLSVREVPFQQRPKQALSYRQWMIIHYWVQCSTRYRLLSLVLELQVVPSLKGPVTDQLLLLPVLRFFVNRNFEKVSQTKEQLLSDQATLFLLQIEYNYWKWGFPSLWSSGKTMWWNIAVRCWMHSAS